MKKSKAVCALGIGGTLLLAACGGSESGDSINRTKNAALTKAAVVAKGSCDDGEMLEGVDDDDCVVSIKIGRVTRKASLQVRNADGKWDTVDSIVAKRGTAKFDVLATDDDGAWRDGQYTYRVFAARSGKLPEFVSADFNVLYGSEMALDDTAEMDGEENQSASPEMQSAMDDIEKPATKFDDNCSKLFNKVDCALMFRPSRGPDFATLGKSKWVKMCSTLLKRPEGECEMEFNFATKMQQSKNPPGYDPMNPNSDQVTAPRRLDPVKFAAACATIQMPKADCATLMTLIEAEPMKGLMKLGDKAEVFCKAYSGTSCTELMRSGIAGSQPGSGGYQPGSGGYQPGSGGYQPGSGGYQPGSGGYQPPSPGQG
jgi:hypothetical protein